MAIAFAAASARTYNDNSVNPSFTVAMPAGLLANQLLLMYVVYDSNETLAAPSGWNTLAAASTGLSSPASPMLHAAVFWKYATGTDPSVSFSMSPASYPDGDAYVLAGTLSYSGVNTSTPFDFISSATGAAGGSVTVAHPRATLSETGEWLLTVRFTSSNGPTGTTDSVGTDVERLDDTYQSELSVAFYDSNGVALSTGSQTQRSTTVSTATGVDDWGSLALTVSLRVAGPGVIANAQAASGSGSAANASPGIVPQPWDCNSSALPQYTVDVDWDASGPQPGTLLSYNPYTLTDVSEWQAISASTTLSWAQVTDHGRATPAIQAVRSITSFLDITVQQIDMTAVGSIVPGNQYVVDMWVWSPVDWTDFGTMMWWYDASGTQLSNTFFPHRTVQANTWTHIHDVYPTGLYPTLSRARVGMRAGSNYPANTPFYVYGLQLIDPTQPGSLLLPGPFDSLTPDLLGNGITFQYGRDQFRQTSPAQLGTGQLAVNNSNRLYSPEASSGPLAGSLDAARPTVAYVTWGGVQYPIFHGRINDYNVHVNRDNRSVDFSFLDDEGSFASTKVTTPLYQGIRTGDAIGAILDAVGWTGARSLDPGATIIPYWWLVSTNASDAINDLVKSEGPPAIFYIAPDGTATFRDRTHRLMYDASTQVQAHYYAPEMMDCTAPQVTGRLSFTDGFEYQHGWRDIINAAEFSVDQRAPSGQLAAVWTATQTYVVDGGSSLTITATSADPFIQMRVPAAAAGDYTNTGPGTPSFSLNQTSGAAVQLTITANGGQVVLQNLQLRAYPVPVVNTVVVSQRDSTSIAQHGEQAYQESVPWCDPQDAAAVATLIVQRYAQRRPLVALTVAASDPMHYKEIVTRKVSDLIQITHDEMGLDASFYVEQVQHQIDRWNKPGLPPVHQVTLGCEKQGDQNGPTPFTFDVPGQGFDQGTFTTASGDSSATVFVFDDPIRGQFDFGRFGT